MNDILRRVQGTPHVTLSAWGKRQPGGAITINADLTGADLSYTDLRGTDFSSAKMTGTKMTGALSSYETLMPEIMLDKPSRIDNQE